MVPKIVTTLLILLPLSSQWDDIQAAATPDPEDNILALQDNDYLATDRATGIQSQPDAESFASLLVGFSCDLHTSSSSPLSCTKRSYLFGNDIICVLMS